MAPWQDLTALKRSARGQGSAVDSLKTAEELETLLALPIGGNGRVTVSFGFYWQSLTRRGDECVATVYLWGGDDRNETEWAATVPGGQLRAALKRHRSAAVFRMTPAGLAVSSQQGREAITAAEPAEPADSGRPDWRRRCWVTEPALAATVALAAKRKLRALEVWADTRGYAVAVAAPGGRSGPVEVSADRSGRTKPWHRVTTAGLSAAWVALPPLTEGDRGGQDPESEYHSCLVEDEDGRLFFLRGHWLWELLPEET